MSSIADYNRDAIAELIQSNLKEVADELRTIDLIDIVNFIRLESFSAIEDLLQSSTELFFKEGTLTFAWMAEVEMTWGNLPTVRLGMEFRHDPVAVFFDLWVSAFDLAVRVGAVLFDGEVADPRQGLGHLAEALRHARLPQRAVSARRDLDP